MKKVIIVLFLGILSCFVVKQSECYTKNHYAYCIYEFVGKSGNKYNMNIITKTFDERTCQATANLNPQVQGKWSLLEAKCVTDGEFDKSFAAVFNNQPAMGVYLSYANFNGFETRVMYVGVAGNDSPVPGFPIDLPTEQIMPLINATKQQLESAGIKNIKIVYPNK